MEAALGIVVLVVILIGALVIWAVINERNKVAAMPPKHREAYIAARKAAGAEASLSLKYGIKNAALLCPHCQTKGSVRTKQERRKAGISGGKATAAILTGGISLVATGLARKESVTSAHCDCCETTWHF